MPSLNQVTLMGNVTRDPEMRNTPGGTVIAEWGMAMNRKYKTQSGEDREETCFVDCTAFGRTAEVVSQYCKKGNLLFVSGRLKYDAWEDRQSGAKRSKLSVQVETVQLMPQTGGSQPRERAPQEQRGQQEMPF